MVKKQYSCICHTSKVCSAAAVTVETKFIITSAGMLLQSQIDWRIVGFRSFLGISELSPLPVFVLLAQPHSQAFAAPLYWQILGAATVGIILRHLCNIGTEYEATACYIASNQNWKWGKVWTRFLVPRPSYVTLMVRQQLVLCPDPLTHEPDQIATSLATRTLVNHTEYVITKHITSYSKGKAHDS